MSDPVPTTSASKPPAFTYLVAEARIDALLDELDKLRQEFHAYKVKAEAEVALLCDERQIALDERDRLKHRLAIARGEGDAR